MSAKTSATRADFDRLMAEWVQRQAEVDALRVQFFTLAEEFRAQFIQTAEIVATRHQRHITDTQTTAPVLRELSRS